MDIKDLSINQATDKELSGLVSRIRLEREALQMMKDIRSKTTSNPEGNWAPYIKDSFSTESIVYNSKSIKSMTDPELSEFLHRLYQENELLRLINDIKDENRDKNQETSDVVIPYEGLDMNMSVKDMYHSGILGMKWGVRRERGSDGLVKKSKGQISDDYAKALALKSKNYKHMSNQELSDLTKRLNLEKSYRELKSQDTQKGLNFIKTATGIGTTLAAAYALSKTPMGQDIIKAVKGAAKKA